MTKAKHNGRRKASAPGKTRAERSAHVMERESLAVVKNLRLMDDTFMSKCLENAPECIELILQIIIGKKDLKVVKSQTEYPIKSLQGRGVRFDVFARDSKDKEYDIEIQRENDVMGDGQDAYSYLRMEEHSAKRLHDGTHIIYVNGATRSESDIGKLMHDFLCRNAAEMYFDILKRQVSQFKNSDEGRHIMCKAVEEFAEKIAERRAALAKAEGEARGVERGKAEGIAEGKREGKRENMLATAKRMLKDGILALKDIARYTGLSLAQVKKLQPTVT